VYFWKLIAIKLLFVKVFLCLFFKFFLWGLLW
jgi:hypothetical protein